mmetsp:Transcript_13874/g.43187  ORF Transcript_13874/g.43187 Transcript_13874/m.43187 type:complete len:203 (+) Transcript_13874:1103-1711(+)
MLHGVGVRRVGQPVDRSAELLEGDDALLRVRRFERVQVLRLAGEGLQAADTAFAVRDNAQRGVGVRGHHGAHGVEHGKVVERRGLRQVDQRREQPHALPVAPRRSCEAVVAAVRRADTGPVFDDVRGRVGATGFPVGAEVAKDLVRTPEVLRDRLVVLVRAPRGGDEPLRLLQLGERVGEYVGRLEAWVQERRVRRDDRHRR